MAASILCSISLQEAEKHLSAGGLVIVPTETVYGLAGDAHNGMAIARIYEAKQRPSENPLIVHYVSKEHVQQDVIWTETAEVLANAFWPGPLTMVLQRSSQCKIPMAASAGLATLAVRVPQHPLFRQLLALCKGPLAAPSANPSGKLSPTRAQHALPFSQGLIPVLEGGDCMYGIESTIIDASDDVRGPCVLREGALSRDAIEKAAKRPLFIREMHIEAPGMLLSHYCPIKPLRIHATDVHPDEGLIAFGPPLVGAQEVIQLSLTQNLVEAAARFFAALHHLDASMCARIAVMPIPEEGIGIALNDRLRRASYRP